MIHSARWLRGTDPDPGQGRRRKSKILRFLITANIQAILALSTSPKGFTAGEVASKVRTLGGLPESAYGTRQAAYDIKKLRGKPMVQKRPRSRRYEALPEGLRVMAALVLLRDKVIKPVLAAHCDLRCRPKLKNPTPIDARYDALQHNMRDLLTELGIAA